MLEITLNWRLHDQEHTYSIRQTDEVAIGRKDDCEVVLPFATISRRHALVYAENSTFYVKNLSRTNTIRVNDEIRLTYDQKASLTHGSVIRLGPVELSVVSQEAHERLHGMAKKTLKIRCSNCGQISDYNPESFCPWCGMSLAGSQTIVGME